MFQSRLRVESRSARLQVRAAVAATVVALAGPLAGCAAPSQGGLAPGFAPGPNPARGTAVRIQAVRDLRQFDRLTTRALEPSLDAESAADPAVRARAVGRRRIRGDVVYGVVALEPDRTVAGLVEQALVDALRSAGYRVVGPEAGDYTDAIPVDANIQNFWLRQRDPIRVASVDVRADLVVRADLPGLQGGHRISVHAVSTTGGGADRIMEGGIDRALEELSVQLRKQLVSYSFPQP